MDAQVAGYAGEETAICLTVLAVDDISDNLAVLRSVLAAAFPDARVLTAPDAPQGLALAFAEVPSVILASIGLPGIDGLELCRQVHRFGPAELIMLDRDETGLQASDVASSSAYVLVTSIFLGTVAGWFAGWYRDFLRNMQNRNKERAAEREAQARAQRRDNRQEARKGAKRPTG